MKIESTDVVGGRCERGNDGTLDLNLNDRAKVVDVVANVIKKGMLQEILYADDIVLIAESMAELQRKLLWLEKCT